MTTYGQDSFTLSLRVQSAQNLSTRASAAFCTMLVWNTASKEGPTMSTPQPKCTRLKPTRANEPVEWNEELQMDVTDQATEVLTIRVKDQGDSLIASCNIYLAHLRPGQVLDQWFQLHPTGNIYLGLVLKPTQRIPTPVTNSSYRTDFQVLLELEMKKIAAMTNQSSQQANIAAMLETQKKAQANAWLMINQHLQQQQQQSFSSLLQAQMQSQNAARFPQFNQQQSTFNPLNQQQQQPNFHEMMGTAANASTIAANLQQLNGGDTSGMGTGGLGPAASIGLGALGLGPLGAFFGS